MDTSVSEVRPCGPRGLNVFISSSFRREMLHRPFSLPNQPCWRLVCLHLLMRHVALGCWARRAILHRRYAAGCRSAIHRVAGGCLTSGRSELPPAVFHCDTLESMIAAARASIFPENQYPACLHVKEIRTQPTLAPSRTLCKSVHRMAFAFGGFGIPQIGSGRRKANRKMPNCFIGRGAQC